LTPIGLDSEWCVETGDLICISYALGSESGLLARDEGLNLVREVLVDPSLQIVGHFLPSDFQTWMKAGLEPEPIFAAYEAGRVWDTMQAAQLDDIARGTYLGTRKGEYSLAALADRYLGVLMAKEDTWRLRYGELKGLPISSYPEEAVRYAVEDAKILLPLRLTISDLPDIDRQSAYSFALYLMSCQGMPTNQGTVRALAERTVSEASSLVRELMPLGFLSFDKKGEMHRHPGKVKEYFTSKGYPIKRTKPTKGNPDGQISVDEEACEATGDPKLVGYARLGALLDIINKDLDYLTKDVVRPKYGLAETGRTTCFSPNMQNQKVAGGIRECFEAPSGWLFGIADYKGLELSTISQMSLCLLGESTLAEQINAGVDAHITMGADFLGISYEELEKRCQDKSDLEAYNARQTGKVCNFGAWGGLGWKTLIVYAKTLYKLDLTPEQAMKALKSWHRLNPQARKYFDIVSREDSQGEPLRHLYSGRVRGGTTFTSRANSRFQGLGGDAAKAAVFALTKICYTDRSSPLYGCRPACFIHDEIILLIPEERGHEALLEMDRVMVAAAKMFLPDVRVSTEYCLSKVWSKKAKLTKSEEGRIIPWAA
jgi:hypothetical protein